MITLRRLRLWHALVLVLAMVAAACGSSSDSSETSSGSDSSTSEAAGGSATTEAGGTDSSEAAAPEGDPIKVGILHSLSGTMSISEVAVHDAELRQAYR